MPSCAALRASKEPLLGTHAGGRRAELDRYIGYWQPYATNHEELDYNEAVQEEVRNAARSLAEAVIARQAGRLQQIGAGLKDPNPKTNDAVRTGGCLWGAVRYRARTTAACGALPLP